MTTIATLYSDPRFQAASYSQQQYIKKRFFEDEMLKRPEVASARPEVQMKLYERFMNEAPAIEGLGGISLTPDERIAFDAGQDELVQNAEYKKAVWLREKAASGDQKAAGDIVGWLTLRRTANETMMGQAIMGGIDALQSAFGQDDDPLIARDKSNLSKISNYLLAGLNPTTAGTAQTISGLTAGIAGLTEVMALNTLLVGSAGAPGLLTKGIFGSLKAGGAAATGTVLKPFLKQIAPLMVEAAGGGAVDVLRSLPEIVQNGAIVGNRQMWTQVAQTFGEGAAWDLTFSAGINVLKHTIRPFVRSFKDLDLTDSKTVAELLKASEGQGDRYTKLLNNYLGAPQAQEIIDQLDPEDATKFLDDVAKFRTVVTNAKPEFNTPEGFKFYAKAAMHDAEIDGNKIKLFYNDQLVKEASSYLEAGSYLSNFMKGKTFKGVLDDLMSSTARALNPEVKILRAVEGKIDTTKLSDRVLVGAISPNMSGVVEPANVRGVAQTYIKKLGLPKVAVETKVIPRAEFFNPANVESLKTGNTIFIPDAIQSVADDKAFLKYFGSRVDDLALKSQDTLRAAGKAVPDIRINQTIKNLDGLKYSEQNLNQWSLESAAAKLGGKLSVVGNQVKLELPGNAPQTFESLADANNAIAKRAFDSGLVDEHTFTQYLDLTGRRLQRAVQPDTGVELFTVRRFDGTIEDNGASIADLVAKHPEYLPKLPETLAPDVTFLSTDNKIRMTYQYAAGPESTMRQALDRFTTFNDIWKDKTPVVIESFADGSSITLSGPTKVTLEVPNMGFRKSFTSLDATKKFFNEDLKKFRTLEQIAYSRGMRLDLSPGGDVLVSDYLGNMHMVRNRAELEAVLKSAPDPEYMQDLVTFFGKEFDESLVSKAQAKLQLDATAPQFTKIDTEYRNLQRSLTTGARSFFYPMRDTLERLGKLTGRYDIPKTARQIELHKRLKSADGRRAEALIANIHTLNGKFVGNDKNLQTMLGKLQELPETLWPKAAKSLGMDLTPEVTQLLQRQKQLMTRYGQLFDVDLNAMITDYAPKIRTFLQNYIRDPEIRKRYASFTKQQIIQQLFAGRPDAIKTVDFFAKHSRLDAFLSSADNKNLYETTKFYIEKGLHEKHFAPYIEKVRDWMQTVASDPNVSSEDMAILNSYFRSISGGAGSDVQDVLGGMSLKASSAIASGLKKVANDFIPGTKFARWIDDFADDFVTLDLPSKVESAITYATLGARPIRGLLNQMQYMNTLAVFGTYADEAIDSLGKHEDEYIKSLFKKGILTERIFSSGAESPKAVQGILEKSLRSQQNTEYLTRAWTARAAEMAFNENFIAYSTGKIDFARFVKLSNMDWLSDDALKNVHDLIAAGKPEAARDLFMSDAVRTLMFDYGKENYPLAFKGVMGRMFGKFGVYPMGQIAMYERMLTRGDFGTKVARALRMVAYSTATYEAFRIAGIDYSGFLFYDPFTFAGGPLYQVAQDVLNSRDTGPQGAMARRNLARSWRLLVPFSTQAGKMLDAIESGSKGELQQALVESVSARYTPDSILNGETF